MGRTSNSKHRLLTAASDLLWEKSYHSVTVDEMCARAGVKKASLYHFFDSKRALTRAALQHFWETVAEPAYRKHFSPANPPLTRITNFLDWLQGLQREKFRSIGRVLGWPFFTLGCELGAQEPMVSEELCEFEAAQLRYFESAIRDARDQNVIGQIDPRVEALSFRALRLNGIAHTHLAAQAPWNSKALLANQEFEGSKRTRKERQAMN
jgi:TetR/AcrR family transcriptional repressor of nem operon